MNRCGLVLEGGAMRGMFTCGVLDVFMEQGIEFDEAVGVSAGVVFGCNLKSRQHGRAIRYNKKYCNDPRYASWKSLIKTGNLFGEEFCYHELPEKLDVFDSETFLANPMKLFAVCTDVETGKAFYHLCRDGKGEDIEWMRASASMPIVSKIVEIGERKFLDGGVADSIPLRFNEHKGYARNVVILTQPADYRKKKTKLLPIIRRSMRRYPAFIEAMTDRHIRYNKQVEYVNKQEEAGAAFVIRPRKSLEIGHMEKDPNELERVYQEGRAMAMDRLKELRAWMEEQ